MLARFASPLLSLSFGLFSTLVATVTLAAEPPKVDPSTLTIIGYHEITDQKNALIPDYAVTPQQFSQHLDWLQNNGFHFVNVDQIIQAHQGKYHLPSKPVIS